MQSAGIMFGTEVEVSSGAQALLERLHGEGLAASPHPCEYHCRCSHCQPNPDRRNLWAAQTDCSCDGELISKPLAWGSEEAERALVGIGNAFLKSRAEPGENAGNHVHVSDDSLDDAGKLRLLRLWLRYEQTDFAPLAQGRFDAVRSYNAPLSSQYLPTIADYSWLNPRDARRAVQARMEFVNRLYSADYASMEFPHVGKGPWLSTSSYGTFEFRIWNSTRATWRLRLHAGMSVACVAAARDGVLVKRNDRRHLLTILRPYMDKDLLDSYHRQRAYAAAA